MLFLNGVLDSIIMEKTALIEKITTFINNNIQDSPDDLDLNIQVSNGFNDAGVLIALNIGIQQVISK